MIYSSHNNISKVGGNLGNQIMRIMSLMGLAKKYNTTWTIPTWPYEKYFENEFPRPASITIHKIVKEPHFHYCGEFLDTIDWSKGIGLHGFFQSPRYWIELLKFKKEFLDEQHRKYDFSKSPIAVSVRRGDFLNHPCYWQLTSEYYIQAIKKFFPDYKERTLYFCSDDLNYCREEFGFFENAIFVEEEPIVQLAIMNQCSDFVISQSTFSYVGAYLAQRGTVIRPIKNFAGEFAKRNSERDFWPTLPNWHSFEPTTKNQNVDKIC